MARAATQTRSPEAGPATNRRAGRQEEGELGLFHGGGVKEDRAGSRTILERPLGPSHRGGPGAK